MDKLLHFIICLLLTTIIGKYCVSLGIILTLLIGISKEIYDYYDYGLFSILDLIADIFGIIMGVILIYCINNFT